MGLSGTFFAYGVTAVAAVVFIYVLLPETKGRALQDIDRELRGRRSDHANKNKTKKKDLLSFLWDISKFNSSLRS